MTRPCACHHNEPRVLLDMQWGENDPEPLTAKGMLSDLLWLVVALVAIPAGYLGALMVGAAIRG